MCLEKLVVMLFGGEEVKGRRQEEEGEEDVEERYIPQFLQQ